VHNARAVVDSFDGMVISRTMGSLTFDIVHGHQGGVLKQLMLVVAINVCMTNMSKAMLYGLLEDAINNVYCRAIW